MLKKVLIHSLFLLSFTLASCATDESVSTEQIQTKRKTILKKKPVSREKLENLKTSELKIDSPKLKLPAMTVQEECDGIDNNKNGYIDEGCFGCCKGYQKADFNCDGEVSALDCSYTLLLAYGKTVSSDITCADLDGDGVINFRDFTICNEIAGGNSEIKY